MEKERETGGSSLREMLAENRRRMKVRGRDALSGHLMPGARCKTEIEGLEPRIQHIPRTMRNEPFVAKLIEEKSIDRYLTGLKITPTDMERDRIADQWDRIRCRHDFYYWAVRYVRIKDKEGDLCAFVANEAQIRLIELFERQRLEGRPIRVVLLKARQWGGSTATQMYMAWIQLQLMTGWNSLIVGHEGGSTAEVNSMMELLLENYPDRMLRAQDEPAPQRAEPKSTCVRGSANIRRIPRRNCKVKLGSAVRPESVRGGDSSMVHCTEVAFWRNTPGSTPVQMMKAATSGVLYKPMTMVVYESSANGIGNFFHDEYTAARDGKSQFEALFVSWYEIEKNRIPFARPADAEQFARRLLLGRYDDTAPSERAVSGRYLWKLWESGATLEAINWYIAERSKYTEQADMASEFPSDDIEAFAHSGVRVFDVERLAAMRKEQCTVMPLSGDMVADVPKGAESLETSHFASFDGGKMKVWHEPDTENAAQNRYVVTVDIGGRSAKADWSVIHVLDRGMPGSTVMTTAAQWRGHIDHDLLAWKAVQVAQWYGDALLVVESNTLETRGRYAAQVDGDQAPYILDLIGDAYHNLYYRDEGRPGFHTNTSTKPMVISTLVECVRDGVLVERDKECIDEFGTYERRPDGSFGAITGKHDDMLMTRAIGVWVASRRMEPVMPPINVEPLRRPVRSWMEMFGS